MGESIDADPVPDNNRPESFYRWTPTCRIRWLRNDPVEVLEQEWLNPSTGKRAWVAVPLVISHDPAG